MQARCLHRVPMSCPCRQGQGNYRVTFKSNVRTRNVPLSAIMRFVSKLVKKMDRPLRDLFAWAHRLARRLINDN